MKKHNKYITFTTCALEDVTNIFFSCGLKDFELFSVIVLFRTMLPILFSDYFLCSRLSDGKYDLYIRKNHIDDTYSIKLTINHHGNKANVFV